jgi:hypothetical protein
MTNVYVTDIKTEIFNFLNSKPLKSSVWFVSISQCKLATFQVFDMWLGSQVLARKYLKQSITSIPQTLLWHIVLTWYISTFQKSFIVSVHEESLKAWTIIEIWSHLNKEFYQQYQPESALDDSFNDYFLKSN